MTHRALPAEATAPLTGTEPFTGLDASLIDFWRFAMSDLRTNNVRGYLAEFLVARAVGATGARIEWDAYDVLAPDGTRIEVKSSGYLQSWDQTRPSRIVFSGLTSRTWTREQGYSVERALNADVYVFAVQTATTHDSYNALDIEQWAFYVLPRRTLEELGSRSIALSTVERISSGPVTFGDLAATVAASV